MQDSLTALWTGTPVTVYPSETNFILLKAGAQSPVIFQKLLERGIRIRYMDDFLRVTVGTTSECGAVIDAMASIGKEIFQ